MKQKVEAEGGELILKDEFGNIAIIPKYLRQETLSKLSCGGCITDIVKTLPKNNRYADTGSLITNEPIVNDDAVIEEEFNQLADKYTQYGWNSLDTSEQDKYRALYDIRLNKTPVVEVKKDKLADEFTSYYEAPHVQNIRQFQYENKLKDTGIIDEDTKKMIRNTNNNETDIAMYDQVVKARENYKNTIKEAGSKVKSRDKFTMRDDLLESLIKTNPDAKTKQCIGGVCNFILQNDPTAMSQDYYSNFTFEKNVKKEGWVEHKDTKKTKPEIGDILIQTRRNLTDAGNTVSKHAKIIIDYQDGVYKVLDNAGEDKARIRKYREKEMEDIINTELTITNPKYNFYRRDDFSGEKLSKWEEQLSAIPDNMKPSKYDIDEISIQDDKLPKYTSGINHVLKYTSQSDIPQSDMIKLAKLVHSIPANESEYGEGIIYKLEKELPGIAKVVRKMKSGTDLSKTLSVGVSQINPEMLPEAIKEKYFKGDSDRKIQKYLAKDEVLAGKVSMELIMDRYRHYRDRPNLYLNDPSKFWYSLAKSWQSPNYAKTEKGSKNISNLDVDYSEKILKEAKDKKVTVKKRS